MSPKPGLAWRRRRIVSLRMRRHGIARICGLPGGHRPTVGIGRKQPPAKSRDQLAAGSLWPIQLSHEPACWTRLCSNRLISADGWIRHGDEKHAHAEYSGGPPDAKGGGAVNTGAIEPGPSEEGRRQRARFNGHIELTDVRIAPPSANLQRTRLMRRAAACKTLVAATIEMSSMRARSGILTAHARTATLSAVPRGCWRPDEH